jgi:hypothetical protein
VVSAERPRAPVASSSEAALCEPDVAAAQGSPRCPSRPGRGGRYWSRSCLGQRRSLPRGCRQSAYCQHLARGPKRGRAAAPPAKPPSPGPHARFDVAAGGNQTGRASTCRAVQAPLADLQSSHARGAWAGRDRTWPSAFTVAEIAARRVALWVARIADVSAPRRPPREVMAREPAVRPPSSGGGAALPSSDPHVALHALIPRPGAASSSAPLGAFGLTRTSTSVTSGPAMSSSAGACLSSR